MSDLIETINRLVEKYKFVMLEQRGDKVYFLREHWRFIRFEQATRVFIGEGQIPDNDKKYVYITEKFPILRRRKF